MNKKIRRGQHFRRISPADGEIIEIIATAGDRTFRCVSIGNRKKQHHITEKTLELFYEKI